MWTKLTASGGMLIVVRATGVVMVTFSWYMVVIVTGMIMTVVSVS